MDTAAVFLGVGTAELKEMIGKPLSWGTILNEIHAELGRNHHERSTDLSTVANKDNLDLVIRAVLWQVV